MRREVKEGAPLAAAIEAQLRHTAASEETANQKAAMLVTSTMRDKAGSRKAEAATRATEAEDELTEAKARLAEAEAAAAQSSEATDASALTSQERDKLVQVGPGGYCLPRHSTHFEPSSLELNATLRRGEQS